MEYIKYNAKSLPQVTVTGKVSIPAPNCHFPRTPAEFIMYFITKGKMIITEGNECYHLKKGDVLFLDPSHSHKGIECNSPIDYFYVHFVSDDVSIVDSKKEDISNLLMQNKLETNHSDTILIPKYMEAKSLFTSIQNQFILLTTNFSCKPDFYKTTAATKLLEILATLSTPVVGIATSSKSHNLTVINLLSYIHENCRRNISSTEIEDTFHANFDYLNRIFKSTTGTTIMNYHNRYRISESKKLLGSGMFNVRQTAEIMGFSNEFYFSRVYKKFEGSAPSQV